MKLRWKFFLIMIIISLVPLFTVTTIAYNRYVSSSRDRMYEISESAFKTVYQDLNSRVELLTKSLSLLTIMPAESAAYSIADILKPFSDETFAPDYVEIAHANRELSFVFQNMLYTNENIYGVYIFTPCGTVLSRTNGQNKDLYPDYDFKNADWYKKCIAYNGGYYISTIADQPMIIGENRSLFLAQALYGVYDRSFMGVILVDCNPAIFDLSGINSLDDIATYCIKNTDTNEILYSSTQNGSEFIPLDTPLYSESLNSIKKLSLEASYDYKALYKDFRANALLLLVSGSLCALIAVLTAARISSNFTYPIEHLSRKMSAQHDSHLSLSGKYLNRSDEIGTLYNEYNSMVEELNAAIKRDYQNKLVNLDAQMKSLEARINSHFLFNTLEAINSIAELNDQDLIAQMSLALGNMFRYSIKTETELVSLSMEINHVQDYIFIQSVRFPGKLHLETDIDEELLSCQVLKLILQPLVENSFYHGLDYCTKGDTISIRAAAQGDNLIIEVTDNGCGIDPLKLKALNDKLNEPSNFTQLGKRNRSGVGLKNIHSRIELYYGVGYGLHVESIENKGTTIRITVPRSR